MRGIKGDGACAPLDSRLRGNDGAGSLNDRFLSMAKTAQGRYRSFDGIRSHKKSNMVVERCKDQLHAS